MLGRMVLMVARYMVAGGTILTRALAMLVFIDIAVIPKEWGALVLAFSIWVLAIGLDLALRVHEESGALVFGVGFCLVVMSAVIVYFLSFITQDQTIAMSEHSVKIALFLGSWLSFFEYVAWGLWTKKIRVNF